MCGTWLRRYALCLYTERDIFMRLSQISFSGFIVNFLWHFVCLLFFPLSLSHSASHSGLLSASFLPIFIVFSTDYSDYCVRCSFQFGSFAALRFSSALNMLFKNFLNRITINLSTSAPRQNSHEVHSGKQAHNTTHEHTMDIDFHFGTREEEKKTHHQMNFIQLNAAMEFNLKSNEWNSIWSSAVAKMLQQLKFVWSQLLVVCLIISVFIICLIICAFFFNQIEGAAVKAIENVDIFYEILGLREWKQFERWSGKKLTHIEVHHFQVN